MIEIEWGGESATVTEDSDGTLRVDGRAIGDQMQGRARHRADLAVAIAAAYVWPEGDWPQVPATGSIPSDWADGSEAWDEMSYTTIQAAQESEDEVRA